MAIVIAAIFCRRQKIEHLSRRTFEQLKKHKRSNAVTCSTAHLFVAVMCFFGLSFVQVAFCAETLRLDEQGRWPLANRAFEQVNSRAVEETQTLKCGQLLQCSTVHKNSPAVNCSTVPLFSSFCANLSAGAKTMRLDEQGQWKPAADSNDEYLLRVAQIKKLVDAGQQGKVKKAARQLKKDFPDIAGKDFDSFMEAEVLLAAGKLTKAVKQYDKFLDDYPASPLRDAAIERQFEIANEFLNGRKKTVLIFRVSAFDDGVKIMEKISDRMGNTDIAKKALVTVAQSYEKRKQYNEAYLKWSEISLKWPTGGIARDALLAMARNKYAAFNGPLYDGSSLISAKTYYENFRLRYPEEAKKLNVDDILHRIDEQLAEKNLLIAKYYERTGSIGPANLYYQLVVDKWPDTRAAQVAKTKIK
jgi:outer membrane protein assembly factor BamD (BamD/ComL family)